MRGAIRAGVLLIAGLAAAGQADVDGIRQKIEDGRYAEAAADARKLLDEVTLERGAESLEAAEVMDALVNALQRAGRNAEPETVALAHRALSIRRSRLKPDDPLIADSLSTLGNVLNYNADYEEAGPLLRESLEIRQRTLGPDHEKTARALANLANLVADKGELAEARSLYEKALAIFQRTGPASLVPALMGNLATVLSELADYEEAIAVLKEALPLTESFRGPEHPFVAVLLDNLAGAYCEVGDYAAARLVEERALQIREKTLGEGHRLVANSLTNLGIVLLHLGDTGAARLALERALRIREAALGPDHPDVAITLTQLGSVHREMGDLAAARLKFERALSIREARVPGTHPLVAQSRLKLAMLDLAQGRHDPALERALRGVSDLLDFALRSAAALSEREALSLMSSIAEGMDAVFSVTMDRPEPSVRDVDAAFDALIRSRAIVLDQMARRHRTVLESDRPEVKARADLLTAARKRLAGLLVSGSGAMADPAFMESWQSAQEKVEDAERALAEASRESLNGTQEGRVGLDDVAGALPPGSALVSFAETGGRYVVFIRKHGEARTVARLIGPVARIDDTIRRWREQVSAPPGTEEALEAGRLAGVALREMVWDLFADALGEAGLVFVVPDGALHQVSFAALPGRGDLFLVETGPALHYLSAERDLLRARPVSVSPDSPKQEKLLVIGGPDFELEVEQPAESSFYRGPLAGCLLSETLRFPPLPGSLAEADEVESLWRQKGARDVIKLTGGEATERSFKKHAAGRTMLHLATHGFWFSGSCEEGTARRSGRSAGIPLLFSGLSLAGANRRDALAERERFEDGVLTAEEVATLDLRDARWVVLSGCRTGSGPVQRGEGVLGLRRAFQTAGADTLITALWAVSDQATRDWMAALYEVRLGGADTPTSMRAASRRILDARRKTGAPTHPFYWGAFLASGNWK
ncbi:MAG: CHAT domain-containing tetratricopeptide repeat protein [Candidatus Polarisedimenticolia bacterium]